jgi:glycosyltransferase involved in cell wall biosynthesis
VPLTKDAVSVLGLVPYPLGISPSQRFRLEQWQPVVSGMGVSLTLVPFADPALMRVLHRKGDSVAKAARGLLAVIRRLATLQSASGYDAVVIHRGASLFGPALLERALSRKGKPLIFDFDDAIYLLHTTPANRRIGWLKFPGKTATLCRLSRHVTVANEGLAAWARQHAEGVSIVPSSVDTDTFCPIGRPPTPSPTIGWTGSSTSLSYLEAFGPILREIRAAHSFDLVVHSDRKPELPGLPYEWRVWTPGTEVEELRRFDIGIMPMPDDEWARGKSAMKALLYMAMGIPAVCSAVGTNTEVIVHGENGLLARTPADWLAALRALVESPGLRRRLGEAGRRTVETHYSKRRCAALFAGVVRGVVS